MKDAEFLELLNLYLDHEISAADAARLEAEVQGNPDRRRVYQDYCRMQKACTLLAKDFVDQPADRKVVAFEPRRSAWSPGLFAVGGLAVAAACIALVLVNRAPTAPQETPAAAPAVAATTTAVKPAAAAVQDVTVPAPAATDASTQIAHTVTVPPRRGEGRLVLATVPVMLAGTTGEKAPAQFEWMHDVQLAPIQQLPAGNVRLDARSPLQQASRTYSTNRPSDGTVQMTAFRFQK